GRLGKFSSRLFDRVSTLVGGRLAYAVEEARHAVVVSSPEVRSLNDTIAALRLLETKHGELQELQPLRAVYERLRRHVPPHLHRSGCGDFQLMARQDWIDLRGYPEVQAFSMNLDGLFGIIAFFAGIEERVLGAPLQIFHLEHESGSGWTPEGEDKLRRRVDARGIPWVDARVVMELAAYMSSLDRPMILNDSSWGFGLHELREQTVQVVGDQSSEAR